MATAELKPDSTHTVCFGSSEPLTCEVLERLADGACRASFSDSARDAMQRSHDTLGAARERGDAIYGLTTGFGPHVRSVANRDSEQQGTDLIAHLGAGCGQLASRRVARATLAARCQTLALGQSGINPNAADALLAVLCRDVCPAIPEVGSVGASGDLIPLAHVARVLTGQGRVCTHSGETEDAASALERAGLKPSRLSARDALALVNGTAFMTAYAALATARADRLVRIAESLTARAFKLIGGRDEAMDARIHRARGHRGQIESATSIAAALDGHRHDASRPLQEVYSLRCAPQVLGACRDQLRYARETIERELNGVNDNPVVCGTPDDPAVLHGGNFQGQHVAFAADAANAAIVQVSLLVERQLAAIANPELNGGAPLLLAWDPGATSGIAGAQITATALAADLRRNAVPSAVASIPTNGVNQDIVSMGTMAARVCYEQTERSANVLAIQCIALSQLQFLQRESRCSGTAAAPPSWLPHFEGFTRDRALYDDIERIGSALLDPAILDQVAPLAA
ncbi:MAG: aromatic amino acid ammonia-lyase [Planctomycetota bacterium]